MSKATQVHSQISEYLTKVEYHLEALSSDERTEILDSLRAHIEDELAARSKGTPSAADVSAVLARMDPPESYARSAELLAEDEPAKRRFSRYAVIGAVWLPFGIITAVLMFAVTGTSTGGAQQSITLGQWLLRFTILPLGILAPFGCTALGLMGLAEIRRSQGQIIGRGLAAAVALFYPLILLDAVIFIVAASLFSGETYWNIVLVATVLLLLILDFFLGRTAWSAAVRTA